MRINCDVNLHKFYDKISTRLSKIIMLIAIVASTKSLFQVMNYSLFVKVVPAILVLIMMIYSGMFKSIKESFYSFMYSLLESTTDTWQEDDDFKDEYKDSYITSSDDESVNNLSIIEYENVISAVIYGVSIIMLITVIFR